MLESKLLGGVPVLGILLIGFRRTHVGARVELFDQKARVKFNPRHSITV